MSSLAVTPAPPPLTLGPATETLLRSFLKGCASPDTRRSYAKALFNLDVFAEGRPLTRDLLLDWRQDMRQGDENRPPLAPATVNLRLTAARKFIAAARRARLVTADLAADLLDVPNLPQRGARTGTWLTAAQCARLLAIPNRTVLRGKRNYAVLAILLGCALRRSELTALTIDHLQKRDDRWIFENIRGKGGRVRSVAIPTFAEDALFDWLKATGILAGRLLRRIDTLDPAGLSEDTIMEIVRDAAAQLGIPAFTPHDLRRTCAKLARKNGGELEQIQYLLGHASLVTTERYLGTTQNLHQAVNDSLGF